MHTSCGHSFSPPDESRHEAGRSLVQAETLHNSNTLREVTPIADQLLSVACLLVFSVVLSAPNPFWGKFAIPRKDEPLSIFSESHFQEANPTACNVMLHRPCRLRDGLDLPRCPASRARASSSALRWGRWPRAWCEARASRCRRPFGASGSSARSCERRLGGDGAARGGFPQIRSKAKFLVLSSSPSSFGKPRLCAETAKGAV